MDLDLNMNPNILVSIVNMKLRNDFKDLKDLCAYYNIQEDKLKSNLDAEDFFYCEEKNQFLIK